MRSSTAIDGARSTGFHPWLLAQARIVFRMGVSSAMPLTVAALVLGSAPASAQSQPAKYVAPSNETVTTTTLLLQKFGGSPFKEIRVQNASSVPIVVYSLTLLNCVNIRQDCDEPAAVSVRVAPGTHELLYRVEPCDAQVNFSFRYTMEWRADTAGVTAPSGIGAANSGQIARLRVEPESLFMHVGQRLALHQQVRVIGLDLQGNIVGPVQSYNVQFATSPVATINADTVIAQSVGRAMIGFHVTSLAPPLTVTLPIIVSGDTPH
jgi:hypothetical protein